MPGYLRRRIRSFEYAFKGFRWLMHEPNARIHLFAAIAAIAASIYFHISVYEWLAVTACIALVFITELINTSIEKTIDLVSPEKNEQAGHIKDMAAAAVLVAALLAVVTGCVVFGKYILG